MARKITHLKNKRGGLIPISTISKQELKRHRLVVKLCQQAIALSEHEKKEKAKMRNAIRKFLKESYEGAGVRYEGDKKGNFTLASYGEEYKITVTFPDVINYNEQVGIARDLFAECLREWSKDGRPELVAFLNEVLQLDKQSRIDRRFIGKVLKIKSEDPRWIKGVNVLLESMNIISGKAYMRFYKQVPFGMEQIQLNFSAL